jgi:uracil phosphoribosyltransferase
MITILGKQNSVFNHFLAEIRDEKIQVDSMRFRKNLERCGEIFAYEISKELNYEPAPVNTPFGIAEVPLLVHQPVIVSLLRAGIPLHQGLLNFLDKAESGFITAYRKYEKDGTFQIRCDYLSAPSIEGKHLIIADTMLASGASMVLAYQSLQHLGRPAHVHVVTVIASKEGLNQVRKTLPKTNTSFWIGAVDDELTVKSFIVPGLGDAGDLAYGPKLD